MYDYQTERPKLFTEENHRLLPVAEAWIRPRIADAGAFQCAPFLAAVSHHDAWIKLAALDYLCEQGIIRRVEQTAEMYVTTQHEVYVAGSRF